MNKKVLFFSLMASLIASIFEMVLAVYYAVIWALYITVDLLYILLVIAHVLLFFALIVSAFFTCDYLKKITGKKEVFNNKSTTLGLIISNFITMFLIFLIEESVFGVVFFFVFFAVNLILIFDRILQGKERKEEVENIEETSADINEANEDAE